jgi:hypothetical protein
MYYLSQVQTVLRRFNVVHVRMASTWTGLKQILKRSSISRTKQHRAARQRQPAAAVVVQQYPLQHTRIT